MSGASRACCGLPCVRRSNVKGSATVTRHGSRLELWRVGSGVDEGVSSKKPLLRPGSASRNLLGISCRGLGGWLRRLQSREALLGWGGGTLLKTKTIPHSLSLKLQISARDIQPAPSATLPHASATGARTPPPRTPPSETIFNAFSQF